MNTARRYPTEDEINQLFEKWVETLPENEDVEIYMDQPENGDAQAFVGAACISTFRWVGDYYQATLRTDK